MKFFDILNRSRCHRGNFCFLHFQSSFFQFKIRLKINKIITVKKTPFLAARCIGSSDSFVNLAFILEKKPPPLDDVFVIGACFTAVAIEND